MNVAKRLANRQYYERHCDEIKEKAKQNSKQNRAKKRVERCINFGIPLFLEPYYRINKNNSVSLVVEDIEALKRLCQLIICQHKL